MFHDDFARFILDIFILNNTDNSQPSVALFLFAFNTWIFFLSPSFPLFFFHLNSSPYQTYPQESSTLFDDIFL